MNKKVLITLSLLSIYSAPALSNNFFQCTVTSVQAVADDGKIVSDTTHLKSQIGSKFTVNKRNGEIRGGYFINNEHSQEIKVTNEPSTNSFYVTTISHGPIRMVGYLYIGNHRKSETKPFIYTNSGEYIYYGFCK